MKFITTAILLGAVSASAAPAPDGYTNSLSKVFRIKDFTTVPCPGSDGISRVYFEVKATDGTNTDFICGQYDPVAREITDTFVAGQQYACSNSSPFTFSLKDNTLTLATTGEEFGSLSGTAPVSTNDPQGFEIVVYPPQS